VQEIEKSIFKLKAIFDKAINEAGSSADAQKPDLMVYSKEAEHHFHRGA